MIETLQMPTWLVQTLEELQTKSRAVNETSPEEYGYGVSRGLELAEDLLRKNYRTWLIVEVANYSGNAKLARKREEKVGIK